MSEDDIRSKTQLIRLIPSDFMEKIKASKESEIHPLYPLLKGISDDVQCVNDKFDTLESTVKDVKNCVLGNAEYKISGLVDRVNKHDALIDRITLKMTLYTAYVIGGATVIGFILKAFKII